MNTSTATKYNVGDVYASRDVYRQAKPYTIPLPYSMYRCLVASGRATTYVSSDSWGGHYLGQWWTTTDMGVQTSTTHEIPVIGRQNWSELTNVRDRVLNRAREKFMAEANNRVSLSVDILQRRQAFEMLTRRTLQAARVFKAIKKLRFGDAVRELGIKKPAGWRPAVRDAGGLWLEYSYGWKPLVQDIFEAATVLSSPIDPLWIQKSSSEDFQRRYQGKTLPPNDAEILYVNDVVTKVYARVGAVVVCDNPNLQALKNAGLTNPLSWVWELTPFSFVEGWFGYLGDFIESLDDTVGLTVSDGFYTWGQKGTSRVTCTLITPYGGWPKPPLPGRAAGDGGWKLRSVVQMTRVRGLPVVKLARRKKVLTNLDRGLNAASLLAQALK